MAVYEKNALLTCKDAAGNKYLLYPITRLECVDGAEDLVHFGAAQTLSDEEMAQARANIGAIPTPATATVGQIVQVAAVEDGKVTAVVAVDKGRATVSGETLIL